MKARFRGIASSVVLFLAVLVSHAAIADVTTAEANRFTYLYQTLTLPRGDHEYEQWVTWKTDKETDGTYDQFEFRQEFEHGISDRMHFAFYLATWRHTSSNGSSETAVHDTAVELVYNLTDPRTAAFGSALYGEVKFDSGMIAMEAKLLLEKYVGRFVFAYNGVFEQEWEGDKYSEDKGELKNIFGASWRVSPRVTVGGEYLWESETENWSDFTKAVSYLGPNATFAGSGWWVATTPVFLLSDQSEEPRFQLRTKIGIPF